MSDAHARQLPESTRSDATLLSPQGARALARVLISGYVDSYALLNFGVYASFMTGNTTSGGLHAGQGNLAAAGYSLLPIPFFLLGIFVGTLLVHIDTLRALRRISFSLQPCSPSPLRGTTVPGPDGWASCSSVPRWAS